MHLSTTDTLKWSPLMPQACHQAHNHVLQRSPIYRAGRCGGIALQLHFGGFRFNSRLSDTRLSPEALLVFLN
jgi:hypothetical protein